MDARPRPTRAGADAPPHVVTPAELTATAVSALRGMGAPAPIASAVAASLVESNLVGHDSHGVRRLPIYARAVRQGRVDPTARPEVSDRQRAAVTVRGRHGFGQLAAALAVRALVETVGDHGIAIAAIRECNHVGRLGEYVEALAGHGLIGMALCNVDPTVAPYGGRERRLGTNPMAWALPRESEAPLVMDWATSAVAEGNLALASARGERVPPGLLVDSSGAESTDPRDFYSGGALLPFAAHKGYGLSVVIEAVGGLLSGTGVSCLPGYDGTSGTVLVAVDPACFVPPEVFRAQTEHFGATLRATPPAPGHDEVLVPGDVERRARAQRSASGIPIHRSTWDDLLDLLSGPPPPGEEDPGPGPHSTRPAPDQPNHDQGERQEYPP